MPGIPGSRGYSMVNFDRAARASSTSSSRRNRAAGCPSGCSPAAGGRRGSSFRAARQGHVPPEPRQEHPLHRRRQRHRRHDVDPRPRLRGALLRAVPRRRVLRRAHDAPTPSISTELAAFRGEFPDSLAITVALSDEDVPEDAPRADPAASLRAGPGARGGEARDAGQVPERARLLAGPPPAVDAAIRVLLLEAKLTADNIRYDKFS